MIRTLWALRGTDPDEQNQREGNFGDDQRETRPAATGVSIAFAHPCFKESFRSPRIRSLARNGGDSSGSGGSLLGG
jgi:hypothetical protein